MIKLICALVATGLVAAVVPGNAQGDAAGAPLHDSEARFTTFYGSTGLINVPTAHVTPHGRVVVGTQFVNHDNSITGSYGLNPGVEVGVAYLDRDGNSERILGNAKVFVAPDNWNEFTLGIGVVDIGDSLNRSFYVIASSDILKDIRIHAGFGSGIYDEKIIGGAEISLAPKVRAAAEWDSDDLNAVVRYLHDDQFAVQAGIKNDRSLFGINYTLSF